MILTGMNSFVQANNCSLNVLLQGDVGTFMGYVLCFSRSSVHMFSGSTMVSVPLRVTSFSFYILISAEKSKYSFATLFCDEMAHSMFTFLLSMTISCLFS